MINKQKILITGSSGYLGTKLNYIELYQKLGFKMFDTIDRVYTYEKAVKRLGYNPEWFFIKMLNYLVDQKEKDNILKINLG
jgi:hypothetical protein